VFDVGDRHCWTNAGIEQATDGLVMAEATASLNIQFSYVENSGRHP
jgi:hypothetical protein